MALPTPSEFFANPKNSEPLRQYWPEISIESAVASLDQHAGDGRTVPYLDALKDHDFEAARSTGLVLTYIAPEVIAERYGQEAVAYGAMNATQTDRVEMLQAALSDVTNYDPKIITQTRQWSWDRWSVSARGGTQLAQYALHDQLLAGATDELDLPGLLQAHAAPGVELSPSRIDDYKLEAVTPRKPVMTGPVSDQWTADTEASLLDIYLDAPVGVTLNYKGKPNAVMGVSLSEANELTVYQLQGIRPYLLDSPCVILDNNSPRGSARGLAPLDWKGLLVRVAEQIASSQDLPSVGVQHSAHNMWTQTTNEDGSVHMPAGAARKTYDQTAQRLGFTLGADGDWHKPIAD